jgi:hypothetical protein
MCAACLSVHYCSRECQRNHWKSHKLSCAASKQTHQELKTSSASSSIHSLKDTHPFSLIPAPTQITTLAEEVLKAGLEVGDEYWVRDSRGVWIKCQLKRISSELLYFGENLEVQRSDLKWRVAPASWDPVAVSSQHYSVGDLVRVYVWCCSSPHWAIGNVLWWQFQYIQVGFSLGDDALSYFFALNSDEVVRLTSQGLSLYVCSVKIQRVA